MTQPSINPPGFPSEGLIIDPSRPLPHERKEHPIIFSGPMVRAILEGRKTKTRRVVKPLLRCQGNRTMRFPYGQPGDLLWVKETWTKISDGEKEDICYRTEGEDQIDRAIGECWRPSIFMPRWASRIMLEITGIRIERVQEITEDDAKAEGITVTLGHLWRPMGSKEPMQQYTHRQAFSAIWDSINAKCGYGWDKNPWVWVIEFKRC